MNCQTTSLLWILLLFSALFVTNGIAESNDGGSSSAQEALKAHSKKVETPNDGGSTDAKNALSSQDRGTGSKNKTDESEEFEKVPNIVEVTTIVSGDTILPTTTTSESIRISSLGAIITAVLINFF